MAPALDQQRLVLAHLPTPVEPLPRLGDHLGVGSECLWVKRDDLTGLAGGGNKARKLEYLCADALARGCDTLVTGGGPQSNHVRMTAAAANRLGLACTVVVGSDRPDVADGNVLLDELLGPEIVWAGARAARQSGKDGARAARQSGEDGARAARQSGEDGRRGRGLAYYEVEAAIDEACRRLADIGRRPYPIPIGGASAVGALGYVQAALELNEQLPELDLVVVADGSGGTHAGLAAGLGDHRKILGIDVGARPDLDEQVPAKAAEVARLAGMAEPVGGDGAFGPTGGAIDHRHYGPHYGALTDECRQALHLSARLEGLILDPVYTGKAMVGLLAACRSGRIEAGMKVVFLHTGGMPALFAAGCGEWLRGAV